MVKMVRLCMSLVVGALLVASFVSSGTAAATDVAPNIVGGGGTSESYTGMASIQVDFIPGEPNFHICGASLISKHYALTSAHCVTNEDGSAADPNLFHLRIGSPSRLEGGVNVGVSKVLPHADWDWAVGTNPVADIALLKLADAVPLRPFEIASRLSYPGATTRLLGWGSTEPSGGGSLPINLKELDSRLDWPRKCADANIGVGEICVHNPKGTDASCLGDSGGPALQKVGSKRWLVVGTMSRFGAELCGGGSVVYTDVTYYRNWINKVMRTGVVPPSTPGKKTINKPTLYNWNL